MLIGAWTVDTSTGKMTCDGSTVFLEKHSLLLLLCLVRHAGEVLSVDDLIRQVWFGKEIAPEVVHQAIRTLRGKLGDDPDAPSYIGEVAGQGYRLIANVQVVTPEPEPEPAPDEAADADQDAEAESAPAALPLWRRIKKSWYAGAAVLVVALACLPFMFSRPPPKIPPTIAVMPLLDLTNPNKDQPFANPMTLELIDKLRKTPGLAVAKPETSMLFRDKPVSFFEFATAVQVNYVLDGSVMRTGKTMRVAVRVTRAHDGATVWGETYNRPWDDKPLVQDEIAAKVGALLVE